MISSLKFGTLLCFLMGSIFFSLINDIPKNGASASLILVKKDAPLDRFLELVTETDLTRANTTISYIDTTWDDSYEIMLLETAYFNQNAAISNRLIRLLEKKTNKNFGFDYEQWFQWLWNKKPTYADNYFEFKAKLHERIDPKFSTYFFDREHQSTIRLDEVRWGGVLQDGIPPLREPEMISVNEATYLEDSNSVFGIAVNGDFRAYPKRILAWHEMFTDTVGGVPVAGVYCTLCGTVILYKTKQNSMQYQLGTSGFLYRSNKLMYDKKTQSLWSTLEGVPVIGPLVGKGIQLDFLPVVTTTWGEWKRRHPESKVLSLNTGHRRNYGEGVAYKDYFATDDLMFGVPIIDTRLKNKDEILAIRVPDETDENLAISSNFLRRNPIYSTKIGAIIFTVFTDESGAHRVYKTNGNTFKAYNRKSTVRDKNDMEWKLTETKMISNKGDTLPRIPTHNAFWFGYQAAFPDVKLIR